MTADIEEMALNTTETAANRAEIAPDTRENGVRSVETTENIKFTGILAALGKSPTPFPDWNGPPTPAIPDSAGQDILEVRPMPSSRKNMPNTVDPSRSHTIRGHLAVAAVARADYLLTWNCRHLANAQILLPRTRSRPTRLDAADGLHSAGTEGRLDA